jgi:hypothetical protein
VWRIAIFAARAFVCIGSILFSDLLRAWARLDPLSASRKDLHLARAAGWPRLCLPRSLTQRGGWAGSRLDGRGFRIPDPFLGSNMLRMLFSVMLGTSWVRRIVYRRSLSCRHFASRSATLTRIASQALLRH